ncbi:MAG: hypothetical protein HQL77_03405 [Magnetococcales bacterium]|nr:hypothetical protein [Magnetococcales bacterium]
MTGTTEIRVNRAEQSTVIGTQINYGSGFPAQLELELLPPGASSSANTPLGTTRFRYTARTTAMLGRERELKFLDEFLDREEYFLWCLVVGPGGSGKSRLALELALSRQEMGWEAGFLGRDKVWEKNVRFMTSPPAGWPTKPTLLIADYILGRPEVVGALVENLAKKQSSFSNKVRLLLLEREGEEANWYDRFLGTGYRMDCISHSRHGAKALQLSPLSLESMIMVVRGWPGSDRIPLSDLWEILERLNVGGRPLYAALLADALQHGAGRTLSWQKQDLIKNVLQRERERWQESGVQMDTDLPLLILATLCAGIETNRDYFPEKVNEMIQRAYGIASPPLAERFLNLTGHADTDTQYRLFPMEPDLLGELLVLEELQLSGPLRFDPNREKRSDILNAAWQYDPVAVFASLSRIAQDYPDHAGLWSLMVLPKYDISKTRSFWALTVVDVIAYAGGKHPREAHNLLQQLATLSVANPGNAFLREAQAKGTINMISIYGKTGYLSLAHGLYDTLAKLATDHSSEPSLREEQARGAFNLINAYGNAGDLTLARNLYKALSNLAKDHSNEPTLREVQARGSYNLIYDYVNDGDLAQARKMYDALETLAAAHPDEASLRKEHAKGVFNLITYYGNAGDLIQARGLYDALSKLAKDHPMEPFLREIQAQGAFNLINAYCDTDDLTLARGLYDALSNLAKDHSSEAPLRELQAKGAFNLIIDYGTAGDLIQARGLYDALTKLATDHPDETSLRELQAKGANILTVLLVPKRSNPSE